MVGSFLFVSPGFAGPVGWIKVQAHRRVDLDDSDRFRQRLLEAAQLMCRWPELMARSKKCQTNPQKHGLNPQKTITNMDLDNILPMKPWRNLLNDFAMDWSPPVATGVDEPLKCPCFQSRSNDGSFCWDVVSDLDQRNLKSWRFQIFRARNRRCFKLLDATLPKWDGLGFTSFWPEHALLDGET